MELVEGETLADFLSRRGALSPAEVLPIARQIGAAIAAAHEKSVIHRDLKSRNVMLADPGPGSNVQNGNGQRVVVMDFGLADTLTQATELSVTIAGTPAYMAPEQFEGKPPTPAVDIYAFGVLLYEMVVGRRPFVGDSPIALALEKIRTGPPLAGDAVPSLPPVWNDVIRRCIDPNPVRRFGDVHDALNLLQNNVDRPPLIRLSRRRKQILAGVVLTCALLAFGAWRYSQSAYVPSAEALRLYHQGAHAQQLGLPWKASQLYEQALVKDDRFIAARASLAEAWMDLDQPRRAAAELQRAAAIRPRWQRVADYQDLLEQAARARLRDALKDAAILNRRAAAAAPDSERPDVEMSQALASSRAGDVQGAVAVYTELEKPAEDSRYRCSALLSHGLLMSSIQLAGGRRFLDDAFTCFEAGGDLDGVAQSECASRIGETLEESSVQVVRRALVSAQTTGNIEQEILVGELLSNMMLRLGEDDDAYAAFSHSMQLADRNGLPFLAGRLLSNRAQYYFDQGDFLQEDSLNLLANTVSRSAGMTSTLVNGAIRGIRIAIRMGLPRQALRGISGAREQLREFPNAALSTRLNELESLAKATKGRPELVR